MTKKFEGVGHTPRKPDHNKFLMPHDAYDRAEWAIAALKAVSDLIGGATASHEMNGVMTGDLSLLLHLVGREIDDACWDMREELLKSGTEAANDR